MSIVRTHQWGLTVAVLLVSGAIAASARQPQSPGQSVLVRGGTLIDGTGSAPKRDTAVFIEGGRIREIGPSEQLTRKHNNARVVDATGKYVLPGLIDSHIHYAGWETPMYPYFGVTSVFDLGNLSEWIVAQRDATNSGRIPGARLWTTGNHLNGPAKPGDEVRAADLAGWIHIVHDRQSTLDAIDVLLSNHVDGFKIQERLSDESLKTVIAVARERHMPIVGHVTNAHDAALLGVKFIEHMFPIARATSSKGLRAGDKDMQPEMFDELITLLVKERVVVNPTLLLPYAGVSRHRSGWMTEDQALFPKLKNVPQYLKDGWLNPFNLDATEVGDKTAGFKKASEFLSRFVKAGGMVLTGTDAGRRNIPGLSLHQEMEILVEAGLSPMDAIKGTTLYPARFFGKEEDLGTVEVSKRGDLLVIDGDPLADISNTKKIAVVVHDGNVIDRSFDYKNPMPRPVTDELTPIVESVTPMKMTQGQPNAVLTLRGQNFTPDTIVLVDSTPLPWKRDANGSLLVTLPATFLQSVSTHSVSVRNPWPGGGQSNQRYFFVNYAQ